MKKFTFNKIAQNKSFKGFLATGVAVVVSSMVLLSSTGLVMDAKADGAGHDPAYKKVVIAVYKNQNQKRPIGRYINYVLKTTSVQKNNEEKPTEYKFIYQDKSVLRVSADVDAKPVNVKAENVQYITSMNELNLVRVNEGEKSYYGNVLYGNECGYEYGSYCVLPAVNEMRFVCKNTSNFERCDNTLILHTLN